MIIEETHFNATKGHFLCDPIQTDIADTIFDGDSFGEIFRHCQKEFGRCTSKVYVDTSDGPVQVGWAFEKREKYEDVDETYMHETWITLYKKNELIREVEYQEVTSG